MADIYVSNSGSDSTGDGSVGNPYATPGKAMSVVSPGDTIYAKGASTTTTDTANVSGGVLNFNFSSTVSAWVRFVGYTSVITDGGMYTLTRGSGLTALLLTMNNANSYNEVRNLSVIANASSDGAAALQGRSNRLINFKATAFTAGGSIPIINVGNNVTLREFEISGGATSNFAALNIGSACNISRGWIHGNAGRGIDCSASGAVSITDVASTDHTGSNGFGFFNQGACELFLSRCTADNNANGNYVLFGSNATMFCELCVSTRSGAYDFNNLSYPDAISLDGCATYGASSGQYPVTPTDVLNPQVLSGMPYAASGDYNLNDTAGAGADCRGIVYPFPGGGCDSYDDSGCCQHQDSGGGGGLILSGGMMSGGMG